MGTKERRDRERKTLRGAILTAARKLAAEQGWTAVSIRKIAEQIEYSPPMIYEYFADKDALLWALNDVGFDELRARLQPTIDAVPDAETALRFMSGVYWDYAHENPEMFRVMNGLDGAYLGPLDKDNKPAAMLNAMAQVLDVIERWGQQNAIIIADPEGTFLSYWCAVNGMVTLSLAGRVPFDEAHGRVLVQQTVTALLAGWKVVLRNP
jgi:AcrR family transcriptional regulator